MSSVGAPRHDPVPIGVVAALAAGHLLAPYLRFLASLSDIQHRLQDGLAQPDRPNEGDGKRAREFGMPPLDRGRFISDAAFEATLERLLTLAEAIDMPEPARAALARTKAGDDAARAAMVRAVLTDAIPVEQLADHLFVAAALQVHFARQAAHLNGKDLVPVGNGVCPACGAPPVASMIVGWSGSNNTRFCACSLCTTQWNYVRIKCTLCGSTEAISYKHVEDGDRLGASGNLRELPRLRENSSASRKSCARADGGRCRRPRPGYARARNGIPARCRQSVSDGLLSMAKVAAAALRRLPSVDEVMRHATLVQAKERFGHTAVAAAVRQTLAEARANRDFSDGDDFAGRAAARLEEQARPNLRPVFNLTGTVLHTNLGRALLADDGNRSRAGRNAQRRRARVRSRWRPARRA